MSFQEEPLAVKILVPVVILGGAFFLILFQPQWSDWSSLKGFIFFFPLAVISENLEIQMPRQESYVSVNYAIILAALISLGMEVALWVAVLSQFTYRDIRHISRYYYRTLFNCGQMSITLLVASYFFILLGGKPGVVSLSSSVFPLIGACFGYWAVNTTLVLLVLSFSQEVSFWGMWKANFRWAIPNYLALSPLGLLVGIIYIQLSTLGVLLMFIPLLIARHSFLQYMKMRSIFFETIKALTKAIDAKDNYTRGHSERVARYVVQIAKEIGLSEDQWDKLEWLALLHDVGKIGVREAILNKPGKFTDEEYEEIKKHSQLGADILAEVKFLGDVDIIRYHHERPNGKGYPEGLIAEKIPFGARILAVADAFDAMTSDRVYRKALTLEEAIEELERNKNKQFDPKVVDAFIRVLRREKESISN